MTTPLLWHHGEDMSTPQKTLSHQAFFHAALKITVVLARFSL